MRPIAPFFYLLEDKAYDADTTTKEELELLKNRVRLIEDNIIYYHEIIKMTPFTVNVLMDRLQELILANDKPKGVVMDLQDCGRPSKDIRHLLQYRFNALTGPAKHFSFCTGRNILLGVVLKFFISTTMPNSSLSNTPEDAIKKLHDILG